MPKVPESTKTSLALRLNAHARTRWPDLAGVEVRFRANFASITGTLADGETLPLCRLRYGGSASQWGFALYRASHDDYQDSFLPTEDLDDCVIGGLRLRQPAPLQTAEISFENDQLSYQAIFDGLHEPFSWHQNEGGCPPWAAKDRYEQSCRVSGRLRFDARDVTINGYGHRDHSWGTRDWRALQHWKWINATAGDDLSLHAWVSFALGDRQVNGYVNRAGVVSPLVDVQAHADLDDRMLHRRVTAVLTDDQGRETTFEAERRAIWQMPIRHLCLNEASMAATIDGRPAVAHVELGWPQAYIRRYLEER